jgi:hypothetical protein
MEKKFILVMHANILFALIFLSAFNCSAQSIYHWAPVTTDWQSANNWSPVRTAPTANDILLFDNGLVNTITNVATENIGQLQVVANTHITLQAAAASTVLTINGSTGNDLIVSDGAALNIHGDNNDLTILVNTGATALITGTMEFMAVTVNTPHKLLGTDANSIQFNSPAVFTQGFRCTGNVFGNTAPSGTVVFNNGTVFIQNGGTVPNANPFALTAPSSKVIFNTGSLYKHQQNGVPSISGRTYANFELNYPGANIPILGSSVTNMDNLTITAGTLNMNMTGGLNLKGNIAVAAGQALVFNPATPATLTFSGNAVQSITNNGTLTFGTNEMVTINNANGVTVNNNITLNNLLTFSNGVITMAPSTVLTLSVSAAVTGASYLSYVDGKVQKIGNTDFIFPVGKFAIHGYVPVGISNFATYPATTAFTAEYKRSSAELLGPISTGIHHVSRVDYWTLDNTGTGTPTVNVTCYWNNESSNGGSANYINSLNDLVIAHFNGSNWDNFGGLGTYGSSTTTAGSITWPGVSTFSPFALASITFANPLPVDINYFTGIQQGDANVLQWQINCLNNKKAVMSIERSADNINFTAIHLDTAATETCTHPFYFTDNHPLNGINYYRLKTINDAGTMHYSNTIAMANKNNGVALISLTPNVISNNAVLHITALQKTTIGLAITDETGRLVWQGRSSINAGNNLVNFNCSGIAAGMYRLMLNDGTKPITSICFIKY